MIGRLVGEVDVQKFEVEALAFSCSRCLAGLYGQSENVLGFVADEVWEIASRPHAFRHPPAAKSVCLAVLHS
jgi:hypothetical protein